MFLLKKFLLVHVKRKAIQLFGGLLAFEKNSNDFCGGEKPFLPFSSLPENSITKDKKKKSFFHTCIFQWYFSTKKQSWCNFF